MQALALDTDAMRLGRPVLWGPILSRHGNTVPATLQHSQLWCWNSCLLQALALGADAVLLGRPVLWGLTLGGQRGVEQVLHALHAELELAMVRLATPAIPKQVFAPSTKCTYITILSS